jgi:hypothetical protein
MVSMSHFVEILTTPLVYFIIWMHNLCSVVLRLSLRDTLLSRKTPYYPATGERGMEQHCSRSSSLGNEPKKRGREVGAPFPLYSPSSPLPLMCELWALIHSHAHSASTRFSPLTMLHEATAGPCRSRSVS